MIYTVTFNPALDYAVYLDRFEHGATNRTAREELSCGGKGINVSLVLRELGVESVALGFLAGFTGDAIGARLRELGVRTDFIRLPAGMSRINVKIKFRGETEINGQGPDIDHSSLEALFAKLDCLAAGDTLVISGSIPRSLPADIYERILARLQGRDIRFVVDAAGPLLANVLPYHPFLIKPNHDELGELCGTVLSPDDTEAIARCARSLQERGARNVLVSMGGSGALLVTEDGPSFHQDVARGELVNSVGAGDSMVAGFLAGWQEKGDWAWALKLGTAAGGATAFSPALATGAEIQRVLHTL